MGPQGRGSPEGGPGVKRGDTPLPGGLHFDPNREGRRLRVPPFCLSRAPSPRPPPHRAAARRLRAGGGPWPARRRRSPASTAGRPGPGLGTGMPTGARLGTALRMSLQRKSSKIHSSAGEGRMGARRGWRLGGGGRSEGSPGGGEEGASIAPPPPPCRLFQPLSGLCGGPRGSAAACRPGEAPPSPVGGGQGAAEPRGAAPGAPSPPLRSCLRRCRGNKNASPGGWAQRELARGDSGPGTESEGPRCLQNRHCDPAACPEPSALLRAP